MYAVGDVHGCLPLLEDLLGRIESKAIEMKLADPVLGIVAEEFAHRTAVFSVKVERITPLGNALVVEVVGRELAQVVAIRS